MEMDFWSMNGYEFVESNVKFYHSGDKNNALEGFKWGFFLDSGSEK